MENFVNCVRRFVLTRRKTFFTNRSLSLSHVPVQTYSNLRTNENGRVLHNVQKMMKKVGQGWLYENTRFQSSRKKTIPILLLQKYVFWKIRVMYDWIPIIYSLAGGVQGRKRIQRMKMARWKQKLSFSIWGLLIGIVFQFFIVTSIIFGFFFVTSVIFGLWRILRSCLTSRIRSTFCGVRRWRRIIRIV